jgi:serine-type D-Ala-D-Ala carboxypeptidase/endopeptidase
MFLAILCAMKRTVILVHLFLSVTAPLWAQTIAKVDPADSAAIRVIASRAAAPYIRNPKHVGLSIGILYAGKRYTFDYGTTDKTRNSLPTSRTIYEIASVTKTFTAILLAHAVLEKKLGLNDDIRTYLPGAYPNLIYRGHPITIVDLANHTAGFRKWILPIAPGATPEQMIAEFSSLSCSKFLQALRGVRLDTLPGTRYVYSNMDVELLGIILGRVYHAAYGELVNRYICKPNGMRDTRLVVPEADRRREAIGYDGNGGRMPKVLVFQAVPGAGFLKSTTADMLNYLQLNLDEKNKAIRLAHTRTSYHTGERGDDIGLCWYLHPLSDGSRLVRCAGGSFGCTSYCVIDPASQLGIVCLTNDAGAGTESELVELANEIMAYLNQST